MDSLLTERWLEDAPFRSVADQAAVAVAREDARALAARAGLDSTRAGELTLAVSELATNQLRHARNGRIAFREIERNGIRGVEAMAVDRGDGIGSPREALRGVPRVDGSLGVGVSSVVRLSDEVDFDVRGGEGTLVRARKFAAPIGRRREVGVVGRPITGERSSGDDAWFGRRGDRLILAVADGLGHGGEAREASARAIDAIAANDAPLRKLCELANLAAVGTRGTVLAIVEIDESARMLRICGAGNVLAHVVGPRGTRALSTPSGVLGKPQRLTLIDEEVALDAQDAVVVFTDGISARARLDVRDEAFLGHPLAIADRMLCGFGRANDDALVLVAR